MSVVVTEWSLLAEKTPLLSSRGPGERQTPIPSSHVLSSGVGRIKRCCGIHTELPAILFPFVPPRHLVGGFLTQDLFLNRSGGEQDALGRFCGHTTAVETFFIATV